MNAPATIETARVPQHFPEPQEVKRSVWILEVHGADYLAWRSAFLHHENATDGEARARAFAICHLARDASNKGFSPHAAVHCICKSAFQSDAELIAAEQDTVNRGPNYHGLVEVPRHVARVMPAEGRV